MGYKSVFKGTVIDATISAVIDGKAGIQGVIVNGSEVQPDPDTNKVSIDTSSSTILTATLLSSGWTLSSGVYSQVVAISGILSTDNPIVDVNLDSNVSTALAQLDAWACVSKIDTSNGSITAYCFNYAPEVDVPIKLGVIR